MAGEREVTFTISAVDKTGAAIAGVSAKLRGLTSQAQRMTTGLSNILNRVHGLVIGGINSVITHLKRVVAIGIGAAIAGFSALAVGVVKTTAEFQILQTRIQTLFGPEWREMWEWSIGMAAKTPYDLREVIDVIALLKAYGMDAKEALVDLGDAAAAVGGGEALTRLVYAIGQMQAATRVTGQEMRQLTELGLPGWDILARGMGKTTAELMDLVSRGLVPASQAIPILLAGFRERFGGQMERQINTLHGRWSNFIDALSRSMYAIGEKVSPYITAIVAAITTVIEGVEQRIVKGDLGKQLGKWLADVFSPQKVRQVLVFFANFQQWIRNTWRYFRDVGKLAIDAVSRTLTALIDLLGGDEGLWGAIRKVAKALIAFELLRATSAIVQVVASITMLLPILLVKLRNPYLILATIGALVGSAVYGYKRISSMTGEAARAFEKAGVGEAWSSFQDYLKKTELPAFPQMGKPTTAALTPEQEQFLRAYENALKATMKSTEEKEQTKALQHIADNTQQMVDQQKLLLHTIYGGGPRARWLAARFGGGGTYAFIPRTARQV